MRAPIGVLSLQGDFAAHGRALERAGHGVRWLRQPRDFEAGPLAGLVLPGGESSTMLHLLDRMALWEPLDALRGLPTLATCAGLILLARQVQPQQRSLGWLDLTVARNGYGRQLDSFEAQQQGHRLAFIRAPRVLTTGPQVKVLMRCRGDAVLLRQGAVLAATFHPELCGDNWLIDAAFGGEVGARA